MNGIINGINVDSFLNVLFPVNVNQSPFSTHLIKGIQKVTQMIFGFFIAPFSLYFKIHGWNMEKREVSVIKAKNDIEIEDPMFQRIQSLFATGRYLDAINWIERVKGNPQISTFSYKEFREHFQESIHTRISWLLSLIKATNIQYPEGQKGPIIFRDTIIRAKNEAMHLLDIVEETKFLNEDTIAQLRSLIPTGRGA